MRISLRLQEAFFVLLMALYIAAMPSCGGGGGTPSPPAISVSLAPSAQTTIDQGQTVSFTATVTNDSSNRGVTWSVSGTGCTGAACGTFTNTTATTATYNAPTPGSSNLTVSVKATSVADTTKSASSTVVVTPAPSITTTSLPNGTTGTTYSATLQATGGVGTLTWGATGLSAWLSLSSSGTLSGTPTTPGTSTFTVQVTDSAATSLSAQQQLSLTVNPGTLTITTSSLPNGVVGTAYNATLNYSGGTPTITWTVTAGTLPDGLSLDPSTGVISGAPTTAETSDFTVTATDSATPTPQTATKQLSITITLTAACGSGNESVLNGKYAFTLSGYNGTGFLAMVGSFTPDGTGNISSVEVDSNGALGVQHDINNASTSSYSVGSDNRGCATIATSFGTFTTRFALGSISSGVATKGRIVEWESPSASAYIAAGQIWQQDSASFSSALNGNYAFIAVGEEPMPARFGTIGALTASSGTITNGEMDVNDIGSTVHLTGATGSYVITNVTDGRATGSMSWPTLGTFNFVAYRVSASEIIFITTDDPATNPVLNGVMRQQSGTFSNSSLNGVAVFAVAGLTGSGSGSDVTIGTFTGNGSGSANITIYDDYAGSLTSDSFTCAYTVASNGRTTLSGNCSGAPVLYLAAANTAFMLGMDSSVASGEAEPQAAGPFNNAFVSGTFFMGTAAVIIQSMEPEVGSVTLDGAGNVSGISDSTSTTSPPDPNHSFTATYSVNSDGTFTTVSGSDTTLGIVISGNKLVLIDHVTSTEPSILVIQK